MSSSAAGGAVETSSNGAEAGASREHAGGNSRQRGHQQRVRPDLRGHAERLHVRLCWAGTSGVGTSSHPSVCLDVSLARNRVCGPIFRGRRGQGGLALCPSQGAAGQGDATPGGASGEASGDIQDDDQQDGRLHGGRGPRGEVPRAASNVPLLPS